MHNSARARAKLDFGSHQRTGGRWTNYMSPLSVPVLATVWWRAFTVASVDETRACHSIRPPWLDTCTAALYAFRWQ